METLVDIQHWPIAASERAWVSGRLPSGYGRCGCDVFGAVHALMPATGRSSPISYHLGQPSGMNWVGIVRGRGGQMSLANASQHRRPREASRARRSATARSASAGSHPEGADVSALEHMLGDHKTIPSDRGIFLSETWRLAPSICSFTSEVFYEGRLCAHNGLERQVLARTGAFDGAGLWVIEVQHEGNQSSSPEEVEQV